MCCAPSLREQIRSIWPDVIVTMGNPATRFILPHRNGHHQAARRLVFHEGHLAVLPTFHPAACARRDSRKLPDLEHDFALLGKLLRGEVAL